MCVDVDECVGCLSLQCTRLITAALQYQDELYEFTFVPEVGSIIMNTHTCTHTVKQTHTNG